MLVNSANLVVFYLKFEITVDAGSGTRWKKTRARDGGYLD